jgi:hypothetical protein
MHVVHAEVEISAPPERVWRVLTDFSAYSQWNPFIRRACREVRQGERLEVCVQPPDGRAMTFRPTVLIAEPSRELRWLGHLWLPGLFDGEHAFLIEPLGDERVRLVQREKAIERTLRVSLWWD